jgi:hypothetical protein
VGSEPLQLYLLVGGASGTAFDIGDCYRIHEAILDAFVLLDKS